MSSFVTISVSNSVGDFKSITNQNSQFGVPLATLLERDGTPVPKVIKFLIEQLILLGGPHTEGIFRLVGDKAVINNFRFNADANGTLTPLHDAIDAAVLIKNWLRALPEPAVPTALYEKVISCPGSAVSVFEEIPEPNKTLVGFIIKFLQFMNDEGFIRYTMMNSPNLASMLAPCLINCPYEDLSKRLISAEKEKNFIMELIGRLDTSPFPTFCTTELKPIPPLNPDPLQVPPDYDIPPPVAVKSPPQTSPVSPNVPPPVDVSPPVVAGDHSVTSPPATDASTAPRPVFAPRPVPGLARGGMLGAARSGNLTPLRGILVPMGSLRNLRASQDEATPTTPLQQQEPEQAGK